MLNPKRSKLFYAAACLLIAASVCAEDTAKTEHEAVWAALNAKVVQAYQQGQYAEGIEHAEQAYQYALKYLGKTHPDTLTSLSNLAGLYNSQGRYGEAEPLLKEALQLCEQTLGKTHPHTLTSLNNLAFLYEHQGRYGEAEPLLKEVLQLSEQSLGKTHPHTLGSLNNLAFLYDRQGRYGEAEPLYQEALQLSEQALGKTHPQTLTSRNNLAALYDSQGRYGEAEPLFKEALQLSEQALGKTHPHTLVSLNNLAAVYEDQGRYGEAEPLYQEALQLCKQSLGKTHPDTLSSLNNLAAVYKSQGRYGEAEPLLKEVLQLSEQSLGKTHPHTLASRNNLAMLYDSQGRYGEAEPLLKETLQLSEQALGQTHPQTLLFQSNYIIVMINLDQPRTALRLLRKMEERLLSRSFQELYSTAEDRIRRLFLKNIANFQNMTFSLAAKFPEREHIRYAADVALKWKQIYAEEYAFQHRLLCFSADPGIARLRADIARLRSEFSGKIHQKDQARELAALAHSLNQAEAELRDKARALKPELLVSGENTERLIGKLPERSALIEFKRFSPFDFQKGEYLSQNWAAYLLLSDLEAEQQVFFENMGSFEDLLEVLINSKDPLSGLYTMFFSKFEPQLKNVTTLYIAPDGFLNTLPFAALKTSDGRYLAQQFNLKLLQTGRDLLNSSTEKPANTLIALGGVNYGQLPGQTTGAAIADDVQKSLETLNPNLRAAKELDQGLKYLQYSLEEVELIETLFNSNCKDGTAQIYTDQQAAESILKNVAAAPRILHLSTHGFYLQKAEDSPLAEVEPMVLSGLALAGANQGLHGILDENGDDGLLYSLEVLGLNLQGTELVSLSACETGKGVIDYSEGVYGLIRAFRTAGAKNVLMTLSKVGDQASKEFMVKFYEIWLSSPEGASPSDALNETWRYFMNHPNPKYRDPAFWSPYVMVGP